MTIEGEIAELRKAIARLEVKIDNLDRAADPIANPVPALSFNLKDAAVVLGISLPLVRKLIADGHLLAGTYPGMTARRVPRTSIDAFLAASLDDRTEKS